MERSILRALLGLCLAVLAGCATMEATPPPPPDRDATYTFDVAAVDCNGSVVGIGVTPRPLNAPGQYNGGHVRIDVPAGGVQKIVWESAASFAIRFEDLKSNNGQGGGNPGNGPTSYVDATPGSDGKYRYVITLAKGNGSARQVLSSKYFLKVGQYELDPVIIVDR